MPPAGCGHNSGTSAPRSAWLGRAGSSAIAPVLFFRDVAQDRRQEIDVAHDVPHARPEAAGTRAISVLCIAAVVEEIGRASCRERVCQYVSISVVALKLK